MTQNSRAFLSRRGLAGEFGAFSFAIEILTVYEFIIICSTDNSKSYIKGQE